MAFRLARMRLPLLTAQRTMSTAATASKYRRFVTPIDAADLPRGFVVASTYAGIKAAISPKPVPDASSSSSSAAKASPKPDLALIVSSKPAAAAGTFTRNVFKAAPVVLSSQVLVDGAKTERGARVRSVLVNSGCANAVTGERGMADARECSHLVASALSPALATRTDNAGTLLLSTGVIGVPLPMPAIRKCIPHLTSGNVLTGDKEAWLDTARAFMTTDTFPKLRARSFELAGRKCRIAGIDKGAGMIHPSMSGPSTTLHATMLGLLATDAPIHPTALQSALEYAVSRSFNCISVDGDMSTNDTILLLANGLAPAASSPSSSGPTLKEGEEITETSHPEAYAEFKQQLTEFCEEMAKLIVRDGEGAEKFVEVTVENAPSYEVAHAIASSVSTSSLVKCALHGGDANWGRILCAVGYAPLSEAAKGGWKIEPSKVTVAFVPGEGGGEPMVVLRNGTPQEVDEEAAAELLAHEDIRISIDLQGGSSGESGHKARFWTCDLSKEYVAINGDYRS
ncbi:Arginine biosynthesis bifunctional protein ArgJ, mitochondrial [Thecaphora frezii]